MGWSLGWGEWAEVEERVEADHVGGHVVGPLEDLWADVFHEGVAVPSAQDLDALCLVVCEEECHSGSGADGVVADLVGGEAKDGGSTID